MNGSASRLFEDLNQQLAPNISLDLSLGNLLSGGGGFNLLTLVFFLIGLAFFANLVAAAFAYILAEGSPEQISKANTRIVQSLIGLVVVASSFAIVQLILSLTGIAPTQTPGPGR